MNSSRKKVLIIEDHESVRLLLQQFLRKSFDVTCKADGFAALAWLSQGNIPDLILLDMSMPKLNGLDFLNNIRTSGVFREIPVLIVSAEEENAVIAKCHDLGIEGYVPKPFNPIDLNESINKALNLTAIA